MSSEPDENEASDKTPPPKGESGLSADSDAPTRITPTPPVDDVTLATNLNHPPVDDVTLATNLNHPPVDDVTLATNLNHGVEEDSLITNPGQAQPQGVKPSSGTALTMPMDGPPRTTSSSELMIEGMVFGDYEIERKLGQGGMGAVFKGRQISLDRPVAIKVLPSHLSQDKGFIDRFQLEARAVGKLTSPYIVQVYGAGESDGLHYFAMEFVAGKDLSERMKDGLRPTPEEAVKLILQAAKGLAAAGDHGIIHRDIKPHNMMVTDDGQLKIMDFGLVKLSGDGQGLTMTGAVMGTVSYFSPEQGRGMKCDQRTDIYATGVVLYELLTGTLPFTGPDATAVIYQHIHSAPRPLLEINPDVPEDLQAVVLKCMQKKPENRYQTAHELVSDLERIAQGLQPIEALKDPELLRSGATMVKGGQFEQERKSSSAGLLVGLGVLAVLGAGGWWYYDRYLAKPEIKTQSNSPVVVEISEDPEQQEAALAIEASDWERAESLIASHRGEDADPAWKRLDQRLLANRSQALAREARAAIDRADARAANAAIEQLAKLAPDDGRLSDLREGLNALGQRSERIDRVRELLEAGAAGQAVKLCENLLKEDDNDQTVQSLRERARGMQALLQTADERLASAAYDTAFGIYTKMLSDDPNAVARSGIEAVDIAKAFNAAVDTGEFDVASARLGELAEALPSSKTLAAAQRRLHLARLSDAARQAIKAGEWAAASETIEALKADDGDRSLASELEQHMREQQALVELQLVLGSGDLAAARKELTRIESMTSNQAVLTAARKAMAESQLEAKEAAAAAAAREQAIVAAFTTLEKAITSGELSPDEADGQLAALAEQHGATRPELPRLQVAIADRRASIAAAALLAALDKAVLKGDADARKAIVRDETFRTALTELSGQEGLVFSHTLAGIERSADGIRVDATLHNGFAIYPERDISCHYQLIRDGDGWVIGKAAFALPQ